MIDDNFILLYNNKINDCNSFLEYLQSNKKKYQYFIIFIQGLINFFCGFYFFNFPFLFNFPDKYYCYTDNQKYDKKECTYEQACDNKYGFSYTANNENFVTYQNLFCGKSIYISYYYFFCIFFSAFFNIIIINLSGIIGRTKVLRYVFCILIIFIILNIVYITNYYIILLLNIFIWGILDSVLTLITLFIYENITGSLRDKGCNFVASIGPIAGISLNIFIIKDTKIYLLILLGLAIIILFFLLYLKESIHLLYNKNKISQLTEIGNWVKKVNKIENNFALQNNNEIIKSETKTIIYNNFLEIIKNKNNVLKLICLIVIQTNITFIYDLILFIVNSIKFNDEDNSKINNLISAGSETLSFIVMIYGVKYFKAKPLFATLLIFNIIFSILLYFIKNQIFQIIVSFGILKFFICACYSLFFIFSNCLFDTSKRSIALGISNFAAKVISSICPFIQLALDYDTNPLFVSFVIGILSLWIIKYIPNNSTIIN